MSDGRGIHLHSIPDIIFADPTLGTSRQFRRYFLILILCVALPALLLAAFVVGIDPYYVFGSPSWQGINAVRPYYETHVLAAKPYQIRRIKPEVAILGSSRVEVAFDPRHPSWRDVRTFNFGLPSSTSYEAMLALLHVQAIGGSLRQAVLGLDFFGFNNFFPRNHEQQEARFAGDGVEAFADFLAAELKDRRHDTNRVPSHGDRPDPSAWNEALYLATNPDVAAAIARKEFKSGREHYELAGRAEHRQGGTIPVEWDELGYLQANPDVAYFMSLGNFLSGYHHYLVAGRTEGRLGGFQPTDWNEGSYLAANPAARIRIALGDYHNGYVHYAAVGRTQELLGGFPATGIFDRLRLHWPALNKAMFQLKELWQMVFSTTAVSDSVTTIFRQSEPPSFDGAGMRVWADQDQVMARAGGSGGVLRSMVTGWRWYLWLMPPRYMYCFTNSDTGMTMFDPYRFMLRRAYEEKTDLRMYITPLHASVRELLASLGLGDRYEYWLKALVRINEEEAVRAGRSPLPLWDFSDPNTITREAIPMAGDPTPTRWFWEYSHYRKATGDLILDRIFGYTDPSRALPADFGVRLTAANIDTHIARSKARLADWATGNELAEKVMEAARNPKAQNRQAEATCW